MRASTYLFAAVPLICTFAAACSATTRPFDATGGSGGAGGENASSSSGQGGDGGLITVGAGGGAPVGSCSADLQNVVDSAGNVIVKCPPDQGCSGGMCVPACQAAANSKGSFGCEFWAPDPPFYRNGQGTPYDGTCYAVFLANTWGRPAQITVSLAGQSFDVTQFGRIPKGIDPNTTYDPIPPTGLPPNEVAVLFLSHSPNAVHDLGTPLTCPVTPAIVKDAAVAGPGKGNAFRVLSDTPVTTYDILPYGGAKSYLPSASLLFPSTSWGTNYVAASPHPEGNGSLWALLVGTVDGTQVTVAPSQTLPGGGALPSAPAGQATTVTINAGEVLQWIGADPTGAVFASTNPIGLFTGSTELSVSTGTSPGGGGHDAAHQQIPHVNALGSEYIGPAVVTRLKSLGPESVRYRIVGVVDATALSWDPMPPSGAPMTLERGQVAEFETTSLFTVRSQDDDHPFAMTQYLGGAPISQSRPGCGPVPPFPGLGECSLGDEDWVNLVPPKQFLQRYVFFTDPTYATTNLVVTRVKGTNGFSDVSIACLGGPVTGWQPVGNEGKYEVAHVDLVRGQTPIGQCGTSRHEASSEGAFGIVVWGTDWFASYGYPAGGNIGSINEVSVPPVPK